MKKRILLLVLSFLSLASTLFPQTASAACTVEVLTPVVGSGEPIQIRVTGIPFNPGDQISNHRFTISSPATGRYVDVGGAVMAANDGTLTISVLNDNDGNVLFPPSANINAYTVEFWQSETLDIGNSRLCLAFQAVRVSVTPPVGELNLCAQCGGAIPGDCKTGLFCTLGMCLPVSTSAVAGGACFNNDQCLFNGLVCDTPTDALAWCAGNPTEGYTPPGKCVVAPSTTPTYNCAIRGGQCALYSNYTCADNTRKSQCSGCWINPVDPTGSNWNDTYVGSCVTPTDQCGLYGSKCCGTFENPTCTEGVPAPDDPVTAGYCVCEGGEKGLGEACTANNQCTSNRCINQKCGIDPSSCVYYGEGAPSESFCESVGGVSCYRPRQGGTPSRGYCCPTILQCSQIGGEAGTNFDAYCLGKDGIKTAIGCIPFAALTKTTLFFITWGIGIGGGFAMLLILYAGIQIVSSSGDPSKLQSGKELLIAAISGVVMVIFSVFLLRLIGVNVLGLF